VWLLVNKQSGFVFAKLRGIFDILHLQLEIFPLHYTTSIMLACIFRNLVTLFFAPKFNAFIILFYSDMTSRNIVLFVWKSKNSDKDN
jgi:hypothetical protein